MKFNFKKRDLFSLTFLLFFIFLFSLVFVSALSVNIPIPINYTIINQIWNNSLNWDGHSFIIGSISTIETDPHAYNGTLAYNSSLENYYLNSNPNVYINFTNLLSFGNNNLNGSGNITASYFIGNGSLLTDLNLTDYAKYQFLNNNFNGSGNFTTSEYGFFGWLGSLTNRITNGWFNNVNINQNLTITNGTSNWVSYVDANGTLIWQSP